MKILFLCQSQFGYHVDTYMYSIYLSKRYSHVVNYLCWDYGRDKMQVDVVETIYIPRYGNLVARNVRYLKKSIKHIRNIAPDICFIKYFRGCSLLKLLFPNIPFVFDIRTGSVCTQKVHRWCYDTFMRFESLFFKNITVISCSLAQKLHLLDKATILPLGSIQISSKPKVFKSFRLLYVGTLTNRHIDKTILGFASFIKKHPVKQHFYTIIGDGYHGEVAKLSTLVEDLGISDQVRVVGRVPFEQLKPYFDSHNIGVSFVPITPFFDVQPVTKTFDYLLSGMVVLGTATAENRQVLNDENGMLINDSIEDFSQGLSQIMQNMDSFSSKQIMKKSQKYHREIIVNNLEKYLQKIVNESKKNC